MWGTPVVTAWSATPLEEQLLKGILSAFVLGPARTPVQDIRYQFQQLTDVVVRALSPGINDPFTAINGIDALTSAFALLARSPRSQKYRQDDEGTPRLSIAVSEFGEILRSSIGHIAIYACGDSFVMNRLRGVLDVVEPYLKETGEFTALHSLRADLSQRQQREEAL